MRIAPVEIQKVYWRQLQAIVREEDYPIEWNQWTAMLAVKPGEDPKDLSRRRDLWIQCHSQKCLMRTLLPEYDRAAQHVVPGSQSGFTKGMNAPAQTLAVRYQL